MWPVTMEHYTRFRVTLGMAISREMRPFIDQKNPVPLLRQVACDDCATEPGTDNAKSHFQVLNISGLLSKEGR